MQWQSLHPGPPAWNSRAQKLPSPSICLLLLHHHCRRKGCSFNTALLSRRRIVISSHNPFPPFQPCFVTHGALSSRVLLEFLFLPHRYKLLWNIFQIQQSTELRSSAAVSCPAGVPGHTAPHLALASRNQSVPGHRAVREHSRQRHHLCWQLWHQAWNSGICWHSMLPPPALHAHPH